MLRSLNDLEGYAIRASDGLIGHATDFFFDDEAWVIRYLVVEAGNWLSSRKVLISPLAVGEPIWAEREFPVTITREQVKNSPEIDTDKPVSRQHEMEYFGYYGYHPYYWRSGAGNTDSARHAVADPHLRSRNAVMNYHIEASDGGIGHVHGLLLDDVTWAIRYLVVETSNWWIGHQVLVSPAWIKHVSWSERTISVDLTRGSIKSAPPYHAATALDRQQEIGLHEHYRRPGYWADQVRHENPQFRRVDFRSTDQSTAAGICCEPSLNVTT